MTKVKRKTWAQRIAAARRRGRFSEEDLEMSVSWATCAVGEAVGYPATEDEALSLVRKNPVLDSSIGVRFLEAVQANDFTKATKILRTIKAAVARG